MTPTNKALNIKDEWERAKTVLREAVVLSGQNLWEGATSRAYYAAFHATQAVLLTEGLQPKSHQGTLYLFNHHFVKPGKVAPEYSQILARAAKYREEADYRHTMTFTKEQTGQTIIEVEKFMAQTAALLRSLGYQIS